MKKQLSIWMIALILFIPLAHASSLQGVNVTQPTTSGPVVIESDIPEYIRSHAIDVSGTTNPGAEVEVKINGESIRKAVINDGTFLFRNIRIPQPENTVVLTATHNEQTATETYTVKYDNTPPLMNVTVDSITTKEAVTANVKVTEPVTLTVEHAKKEGDAPNSPYKPIQGDIEDTTISLSWNAVEDAVEYSVIRNGKRIKVVNNAALSYTDNTVGSNIEYKYQITAINEDCIESERSDLLVVRSKENDQEERIEEATFTCEIPAETYELTESKDITVKLLPGENLVSFKALDAAGFVSVTEERIVFDTGPPTFIENNLQQLSPSYSRTVLVKGKISEQGSITAFVNGKAQTTNPTNMDGTFEFEIVLDKPTGTGGSVTPPSIQGNAAIDTEISWTSKVRLEAVDAVGLTASTEEIGIQYAVCGYGTWFDVELSDVMPNVLTPHLVVNGMQQLGIAYSFEYVGGNKATVNAAGVKPVLMQLSPELASDYDNKIITISTPPARLVRGDNPKGQGYIQINFNAMDDPWAVLGGDAPDDPTLKDKEDRIFEHRKEECKTPASGCMRFFLELQIPFQETTTLNIDPLKTGSTANTRAETRTQKVCIDVEIAVDKSFRYTDILPSEALQKTSEFFGKIIDGIDTILEPIDTIGRYLTIACNVGTFVSLVPLFLEKYSCEYKKIETIASGEGAFNEEIAAIDACEAEYGQDSESADNCDTCASWKGTRKWLERTYRQICDRVSCPTAPTLQYYLKLKTREKPKKVPSSNAKNQLSQYSVKGELYSGSDCALWVSQQSTGQTTSTNARAPPNYFYTTSQVQGIYQKWLEHEGDDGDSESGIDCSGLHPAHPDCCGYEYMQEWSSACGVSAFGSSLDTFDEIKESTCLSAERVGKNEIPSGEGTTTECGSLLNSVGGFCDPKGGPTPEVIKVVRFFGDAGAQPTGMIQSLGLGSSAEKFMYMLVVPKEKYEGNSAYRISLGYIMEKVKFEQSARSNTVTDQDQHFISSSMQAIELREGYDVQERFFAQEDMDKYYEGKGPRAGYPAFTTYLCKIAGYTSGSCGINGENVYNQVMAKIGTPEQEYIIKPGDGIMNSIRCMCFPTLIAFLKQWKQVMQAIKGCIDTIYATGDGEAGVCQAIISERVCDFIYEILTCFTQKFSSGQARVDLGGDVIGALTSAGSAMARSVEERYGETSTYDTIFVQRKFVHSVCMFAFTGTWDIDLAAAWDNSVEAVPIDSQALVTPCTRRFISFNPATQPPGMVNWLYEIGVFVVPGADIDVELHLVCSGGYNCKESDGFENNKCDCDAPRDIAIRPSDLPTRLKKGETLSKHLSHLMQGSAGPNQIRYDKAYLFYKYKDGNEMVEKKTDTCTISQTGGTFGTPDFCRMDLLTNTFRCQFGEDLGGIRITDVKPNYIHKIPTDVFAVNDFIDFSVQLQQTHYGENNQNKHLEFAVMDPQGKVVETNKNGLLQMLTGNGDYVKHIGGETSTYGIKAKQTWFQTAGGAQNEIKLWTSTNQGVVVPGSTLIQDVKFYQQGVVSTAAKQFILTLTPKTGGGVTYHVYPAAASTAPTPSGLTGKGTQICTGDLTGSSITCQLKQGTTVVNVVGEVVITLTAKRPQGNERLEAHINYGKRTENVCTGDNKLRPQPFRFKATIYDSDKFGQPTTQPSLDPISGTDVTKEITFNLVCADNQDPSLLAQVRQTSGQLTGTEVLQGLDTVLNGMIASETLHVNQLTSFLQGDINTRKIQIEQYMDTIIQDEPPQAVQLTRYLTSLQNTQDANLVPIRTKLTQLYNMLRMPTPQETQSSAAVLQTSIPYRVRETYKKELREEIAKPTLDVNLVRTKLQELLNTRINPAIALKREILTAVGAAQPTPTVCADKQTDTTGNYYICAASAPGAPYVAQPNLECRTVQATTCYKLPKESLCPAQLTPITDNLGTQYQCSATVPAGFTEVQNKLCTDTTKKCYSKQLSAVDLYNRISDTVTRLKGQEEDAVRRIDEYIPALNIKLLFAQISHFTQGILTVESQAKTAIDTYIATLEPRTEAQNQALKTKLGLLNTALDPVHDLATSLQNTKQYVDQTLSTGNIPTDENVRILLDKLRIVKSNLQATITHKNAVLSQITGVVTVSDCPDKQTVNGVYYECSSSQPLGFVEDPTKQCRTVAGQKCYGVLDAMHCAGTKLQHNLQCGTTTCPTGWTPFYPVSFPIINFNFGFYCGPSEGNMCCTQSVLGAPVTPQEQLIELKEYLFTGPNNKQTVINRQQQKYLGYSQRTDAQVLSWVTGTGKTQLLSEIDQTIAEMNAIKQGIDAIKNKPLKGGAASIIPPTIIPDPTGVNAHLSYYPRLNTLIQQLQQIKPNIQSATTPAQLKQHFETIGKQTAGGIFYPLTNDYTSWLAGINSVLGVKDPCPNAIVAGKHLTCLNTCTGGELSWTQNNNYACGGSQVCCEREANPIIYYSYPMGLSEVRSTGVAIPFLQPNTEVNIRMIFSAEQQSDISRVFSQVGTMTTPATSINFVPTTKMATAQFTLRPPETTQYRLAASILGTEYASSFTQRIGCELKGYFCENTCNDASKTNKFTCADSNEQCCINQCGNNLRENYEVCDTVESVILSKVTINTGTEFIGQFDVQEWCDDNMTYDCDDDVKIWQSQPICSNDCTEYKVYFACLDSEDKPNKGVFSVAFNNEGNQKGNPVYEGSVEGSSTDKDCGYNSVWTPLPASLQTKLPGWNS